MIEFFALAAFLAGAYYFYSHKSPSAPQLPAGPTKDLVPSENDTFMERLHAVDALFGTGSTAAEWAATRDQLQADWAASIPSKLVQDAADARHPKDDLSPAGKHVLTDLSKSFRDRAARISGMSEAIDRYLVQTDIDINTDHGDLDKALDISILPVIAISKAKAVAGAPPFIAGPVDVFINDRKTGQTVGEGTVSNAQKIKDVPPTTTSPAATYYIAHVDGADAANATLVGQDIGFFVQT